MGIPLHTQSELTHVVVNSAAGGTLAVASAVTGSKIGIYRMLLVANSATTITIQDTASSALSAPYSLLAGGSIIVDTPINGDPWWQSTAGKGLQINSSAAVQVSADVYYLVSP
ncbi:MAG TPA: hypothetical protein VKD24_02720 [Candidatus Angelobacter sp.]|nr:hypothetical protein [Candidatus Angelobacter sp.]